jgi:hypothetical protein
MVVFSTTLGEVTIELYPEKAPITVENFLAYVDAGFYDGTIFHRVVPGFVIQGGGFTESMEQKSTRPPIKNEADNGLKNERGTHRQRAPRSRDPRLWLCCIREGGCGDGRDRQNRRRTNEQSRHVPERPRPAGCNPIGTS